MIVVWLILMLHLSFYSYSFTPKVDGVKELEWDSEIVVPNRSGYNNDPCKELYVTDDGEYLYLLYWYMGDQNSGDGLSAHNIIAIDVKEGGGQNDPWQSSTIFSNILPDFIISSYHNSGNSLKDTQLRKWDNGWRLLGSIGEYDHYENINGWSEIRIPLSTLGVGKKNRIRVVQYYRYDQNKPGYSDSTPHNSYLSDNSASPGVIYNFWEYEIKNNVNYEDFVNVLTKSVNISNGDKFLVVFKIRGLFSIEIVDIRGISVFKVEQRFFNQGETFTWNIPGEISSGFFFLVVKGENKKQKFGFVVVK